MNRKKGSQRPLSQQLREWFESNPGEVLTLEDVTVRWEVSEHHALHVLRELGHEGLVMRQAVYTLDPDRPR